MIQPQTHLNVADNSGARELMCIRILGASNRRYAYIGDIVVAVIKQAVPNTNLERSEVIRAVIVRTCKELKRSNGIIIQYDDNAGTIENMDEIGAAILVLFSAMTIGGIFWMGVNYWRKTRQELVKLQYTSVTPETIEDYYRATAKAVRKVGVSVIIFAFMLGVFSQFNSVFEVIGLAVFLFGITICFLSLAPRALAKQIQKQNVR